MDWPKEYDFGMHPTGNSTVIGAKSGKRVVGTLGLWSGKGRTDDRVQDYMPVMHGEGNFVLVLVSRLSSNAIWDTNRDGYGDITTPCPSQTKMFG